MKFNSNISKYNNLPLVTLLEMLVDLEKENVHLKMDNDYLNGIVSHYQRRFDLFENTTSDVNKNFSGGENE